MDVTLTSGSGNGRDAVVNEEGRLQVGALSIPVQMHEAAKNGRAFQLVGEANPNNNTVVVLQINNTSVTRALVFTYLRAQLIGSGGTAFPATAHYVEINYDQTYSSGGTAETATNTNAGSSTASETTAYDNNPTLAGTAVQVDKQYFQSNADVVIWNKQGGLVVPPGKDINIAITTDHTTATALVRASWVEVASSEL